MAEPRAIRSLDFCQALEAAGLIHALEAAGLIHDLETVTAVCMICREVAPEPDTAHLLMTNIYTPGGGGSWWVCRDADGCRARAGDLERAL